MLLTIFSFWGVFWVDGNSYTDAEKHYIEIAKMLDKKASSLPEAVQVLSQINHPWLLIIDNADDISQDYDRYFPTGNRGIVLMTSRNPHCRVYQTIGCASLGGLPSEVAIRLVLKAAEIPLETQKSLEGGAHKVCTLFDGHPFALISAGSYIARGYCNFDQYPQIYQR